MSDICFGKENDWIKKKDLVEGKVYCTKAGLLYMYIGISYGDSRFIFFRICSVMLARGNLYKSVVFDNIVRSTFDAMIKNPITDDILVPKTLPLLYKNPYPNIGFDKKSLSLWWAKLSMFFEIGIKPTFMLGDSIKSKSRYVSAKDLVVGQVYKTTDDGWRSEYLYLGRLKRGSSNFFIYSFVNSDVMEDAIRNNDMDTIIRYSNPDLFVSNKRVMICDRFKPMNIDIVSEYMKKYYMSDGYRVKL